MVSSLGKEGPKNTRGGLDTEYVVRLDSVIFPPITDEETSTGGRAVCPPVGGEVGIQNLAFGL